jgi:peptidoglycan-associated lipoprotein
VKRLLLPVLLIVGLSGCETMGISDKSASIEDRNASLPSTAPAATPATPSDSAAAKGAGSIPPGVQTAGLGTVVPSGQTLDTKPLDGAAGGALTSSDPRRDPANPLSQRSVFFDFDSFAVKDEYRTLIEAHAGYLTSNRQSRVILQGNADERGSREYNLALGQKRAEAVRRVLNLLGVQDERLEAISFGEEKPRALGDTEEDYAKNRRTDILYGDE